jgi:hypothetical protein
MNSDDINQSSDENPSGSGFSKNGHQNHPSDANGNPGQSQQKLRERIKARWQKITGPPTHEIINTFFTIVIGVATTVYAVEAYHQLGEMKQSGQDYKTLTGQLITAAGQQATAAGQVASAADRFAASAASINAQIQNSEKDFKRMADNATREAQTTRESLTSVQRAFLKFDGQVPSDKIIESGVVTKLTLDLHWTNIGNTAARNVYAEVNWKAMRQEMPDDYKFPDLSDIKLIPVLIAREQYANATVDVPIDWFNFVRSDPNWHMYVYGWTTYQDVFNGTPVHLSEFCVELVNVSSDKENMSDPLAKITWKVILCKLPHNCADDTCEDYKQKTKGR